MRPSVSRLPCLLVLASVLAGLLVFGAKAGAQEVIAVDQANPPFMYAGQDGKPRGIYPALIGEAFKRMSLPVTLRALPWKRALSGIDAGENGVGGIYSNSERTKKYDFTDKMEDEVILVYVARDRVGAITPDLNGLKGRRVGVILGWSYGDDFDAAAKAGMIRADPVDSDAHNFAKLAAGRLDAVLAIREAGDEQMRDPGYAAKLAALGQPFLSNPAYLAFAKSARKTELIARFNRTLVGMRKDGSYRRIVSAALNRP